MSTANAPERLSYTHLDMARWLMENPTAPLADMSKHFGYTVPWLSTLINCDAFQAHLRTLEANADTLVVADIPAKLRGLASRAIDGLADAVEKAQQDNLPLLHRVFLRETVDMTLKSLGYGTPKAPAAPALGGPQQNNFYFGPVAPEVLANARGRLLTMETQPGLPETNQLPAGAEREERAVLGHAPDVPEPSDTSRPETAGYQI
jgi:hypothetical protein